MLLIYLHYDGHWLKYNNLKKKQYAIYKKSNFLKFNKKQKKNDIGFEPSACSLQVIKTVIYVELESWGLLLTRVEYQDCCKNGF